ncbi:hypothetical protein SFHH103_03371 [Sinorhizobium fredii HH103]|uniref:Metallo-beta-lactamase domain-containing protein n=1 Tax=Sinorhizobium fredii (strain HH103) TaxID=1117943 RepID=G9A3B5_SINF1|nr:hypothetical protein [Sinorhizobium fredii]CCE97863.1 hypothetical protein SFHH103_03371 [Sinorhizobium fredii HH103]
MSDFRSVRIRMYRGILGDCFLIRTTVNNGGADVVKSILIDCGVLQNVGSGQAMIEKLDPAIVKAVGQERLKAVEAGPDRIKRIAQNVLDQVKNRIDLLVITHEHADHLTGFSYAKEAFLDEKVTIGELWTAWTESPNDTQARTLQARFGKGKKALASAVRLATAMGVAAPSKLLDAAALAAFSDPVSSGGMGVAGGLGTADIIRMIKDKAGPAATRYLEPGEVLPLKEFGLTAYILGPPRLEALLKKDSPSRGHAKEVYLTQSDAAAAVESTTETQLALREGREYRPSDLDGAVPFSVIYRRPMPNGRNGRAKAKSTADTARHANYELYTSENNKWRTIDEEWTGAVESLALKMDSDTNNTSLAIAFELPDGQVLLFPGDAQVGNWLSWGNQTYPPTPGPDGKTPVTIDDLLRRVTFYKVGHHGSHNATLKALGLEKMRDPRLTAAIPVVEAVAAVQGKGREQVGAGWKMPYGDLLGALRERTSDRIVRGDGDPVSEKAAFIGRPTDPQRPVSVEHDDLWVELTFPLA